MFGWLLVAELTKFVLKHYSLVNNCRIVSSWVVQLQMEGGSPGLRCSQTRHLPISEMQTLLASTPHWLRLSQAYAYSESPHSAKPLCGEFR